MRFISGAEIESVFEYEVFIPRLKEAFCSNYIVPERHHHEFDNGVGEDTSTLLLMPAWSNGEHLGVKMVTVSPYNGESRLPAIQGIYTLMDASNGVIEVQMDAKVLTTKRTAATSALASCFLSREKSSTLFMVGTGALAPELIKAHSTVRSINKVLIWGRNKEHAERLKSRIQKPGIEVEIVLSLEEGTKKADIISVATLSKEALVLGKWLQPGQHLDLVGAYKPDMRETDDDALKKASIYVDHDGALRESGDLAIPLKEGTLKIQDIKNDLKSLCTSGELVRVSDREITLFKSVGHALEDLAGALYLLDCLKMR